MQRNWLTLFARVRGALMRRGRSSQDADDLVQEAWLRLACHEQAKPVDRPEPMLMRIALNLSIDAHRARVRRGEEVLVEDDAFLIDTAPSAEAALLARERVARLGVCLGRLSDKTREIFLAHLVDGLTYKAIAQQRGLSVSTVEWHVARATLLITRWMEGW